MFAFGGVLASCKFEAYRSKNSVPMSLFALSSKAFESWMPQQGRVFSSMQSAEAEDPRYWSGLSATVAK